MMTPQEQRIALAEWDGWSHLDKPLRVDRGFEGWGNAYWTDYNGHARFDCPDYPSDLNAVHELEKKLTMEQARKYNEILCKLVIPPKVLFAPSPHSFLYHSSAAQRCEALCRVLFPERWKD